MTDAIVAEGLVKTYGSVRALDGIDVRVPEGTVLGLLGPNGAGKTTCVRILTTLLKPDSGRVIVDGIDVLAHPQQVRQKIGLSGQNAAIDEYLTGYENLEMIGRLYHIGTARARQRAHELLERFELTEAANRPAKTYSGGMRRRLDLAGDDVLAYVREADGEVTLVVADFSEALATSTPSGIQSEQLAVDSIARTLQASAVGGEGATLEAKLPAAMSSSAGSGLMVLHSSCGKTVRRYGG